MRPGADTFSRSFFHLASVPIATQACQGTACFVARHRNPDRWADAEAGDSRVYCLGKCYVSPAVATDDVRPNVTVDATEAVVLGRIATGRPPELHAYVADGGYAALERALAMQPDAVVEEVEASGLRGRGGAGVPDRPEVACRTGTRRRPSSASSCNADEGDPGAYIDRVLLEDDPHAVLEGLAIAARRGRCDARAYVYVRKEYPQARQRLTARGRRGA